MHTSHPAVADKSEGAERGAGGESEKGENDRKETCRTHEPRECIFCHCLILRAVALASRRFRQSFASEQLLALSAGARIQFLSAMSLSLRESVVVISHMQRKKQCDALQNCMVVPAIFSFVSTSSASWMVLANINPFGGCQQADLALRLEIVRELV